MQKIEQYKGDIVKHIYSFKAIKPLVLFLSVILSITYVTAAEQSTKIFILGDSLTAGYGLKDLSNAFPNKLEQKLNDLGLNVQIVNAGVSGDTSTGANERVVWALGDVEAQNIKYAIIELGANDAFRGIAPKDTKKALQQIVDKLKAANLKILLTGMLAPPNMGAEYEQEFAEIYKTLAKDNELMFYPFFLEGVAGIQKFNQKDGIHPTPEGVDVVVQNILPVILKLIK